MTNENKFKFYLYIYIENSSSDKATTDSADVNSTPTLSFLL